jgi:hypothetical protein
MSIVNVNGQAVTSEKSNTDINTPPPPQPVTTAEMNRIIGAYARRKELNAVPNRTGKEDAELAGLVSYITNALLANAEELFGAWVVLNQEYTPLITGFTAILNRALARIDAANRSHQVQPVEVTQAADAK